MNAIVPIGSSGIVPQGFDEAARMAKAMASIKSLPKHCHDDVGTCLMIVDQAMRWRMSPFAVAQESANIQGKMMYSGKLMAAAVESTGAIEGHFDYSWSGEGDDRTITVRATRTGEHEPREMKIRLGDVKTDNAMWKKQPDQQLVYSGSRNWARRWTPAALLGVYAPEEFSREDKPVDDFTGQTIEATPEPSQPTLREQMNAAVPMQEGQIGANPPQRTRGQFLDGLEIAARDCGSLAEVNRMIAHPDTQRAMATFQDAHKARLDGIIAAAIAAHAPVEHPEEDGGWPGVAPQDLYKEAEAVA